MSKYTTEVRYICENAAGYDESKGYADVDQIIADSIEHIFSFAFPIFDEEYRNVLCSKILRHYYTREIGFETVGLWKLKMQTKLNEIMPYYNQLYNSELIKFNPLYDVDLHTTHVGDKNSETTKEENKTGISSTNSQRSETGSINKASDNVVGENKSGNNSVDGSVVEGEKRSGSGSSEENSVNFENNKVAKNQSTSESGTDEKNRVNSNNYSDAESNLHYDLYSDTPQGALDGVEDEEYLTNARKVTDTKSASGKKDDSEIANDKYSKSGSNSGTETGESSNVGENNVRNSYDETNEKSNVKTEVNKFNEKNDRTSITNEKSEDNRSSSDTSSRNDMENMKGSDKFNSTESYLLHVVGKQAGVSYSKLLKEFRETFLNIDMDVINSLSDLFLNLW